MQTRALLLDSLKINGGRGSLVISVITKDIAYLDTDFNSSFTKRCDCALFSLSVNFEQSVVKTLTLLVTEILIFVEHILHASYCAQYNITSNFILKMNL